MRVSIEIGCLIQRATEIKLNRIIARYKPTVSSLNSISVKVDSGLVRITLRIYFIHVRKNP